MKFIDTNRYGRSKLLPEEKEFLQKLVPFAELISSQIKEKSDFYGINSPFGIFPSLIIAMIVIRTNWGEVKQVKKLNNLMCLLSDESWKGKTELIEGKKYRSYQSWLDFSIDFSDYVTFFKSKEYTDILLRSSYQEQLDKIANINDSGTLIYANIESIVIKYGLWEFD
jgi:uncharacterized FlgJ-related protein